VINSSQTSQAPDQTPVSTESRAATVAVAPPAPLAIDHQDQLQVSLLDQGVPQNLVDVVSKMSGALQGVGNGAGLLTQVLPPEGRNFIPQILAGANDALAKATGSVFWIMIVSGCAALILTLVLRDRELTQKQAR
jgi:hypothetical protein